MRLLENYPNAFRNADADDRLCVVEITVQEARNLFDAVKEYEESVPALDCDALAEALDHAQGDCSIKKLPVYVMLKIVEDSDVG